MEEIRIDKNFLKRIKNIIHSYEDEIPNAMFNYYREILNDRSIEGYMAFFSLNKEKLLEYAKVCHIMDIYSEITDIMDLLKEDEGKIEQEDLEEYQADVTKFQDEGKILLTFLESKQKDRKRDEKIKETYSNSPNLIIYTRYIGESKDRTMNARSGKEENTQKAVANLIEQLRYAEYQTLRKNGYIHQTLDVNSHKPCYINGNAFERTGRCSTKVNYIRISVSKKNREIIKKYFNIDFDTFYLIVSYGDFLNEGLDEIKYYNKVCADLKRHNQELLTIIDIFKNDFTEKTFPLARDIIDNGFRITEEITSVLKNKKLNS